MSARDLSEYLASTLTADGFLNLHGKCFHEHALIVRLRPYINSLKRIDASQALTVTDLLVSALAKGTPDGIFAASFSHTEISDRTAEVLADMAKNRQLPLLQSLTLNGTALSGRCGSAISTLVSYSQKLKFLELAGTAFGDVSLDALSRQLGDGMNRELVYIDLSGTQVTDGSIVLFCELCDTQLTGLSDIALIATRVGDYSANAFAKAIRNGGFRSLTALSLHGSQIGKYGIDSLKNAIRERERCFPDLPVLSIDLLSPETRYRPYPVNRHRFQSDSDGRLPHLVSWLRGTGPALAHYRTIADNASLSGRTVGLQERQQYTRALDAKSASPLDDAALSTAARDAIKAISVSDRDTADNPLDVATGVKRALDAVEEFAIAKMEACVGDSFAKHSHSSDWQHFLATKAASIFGPATRLGGWCLGFAVPDGPSANSVDAAVIVLDNIAAKCAEIDDSLRPHFQKLCHRPLQQALNALAGNSAETFAKNKEITDKLNDLKMRLRLNFYMTANGEKGAPITLTCGFPKRANGTPHFRFGCIRAIYGHQALHSAGKFPRLSVD